jgi:hypothetical protein
VTWADFIVLVDEHLGVDATRRGIEKLRLRAARDAVLDLQRYIRAYRQGHQTTYLSTNLSVVTNAHLGALPPQAKPKAFYTISTALAAGAGSSPDFDSGDFDPGDFDTTGSTPELVDPNCQRNRMRFHPWRDRRSMVCRTGKCDYLYTISPFSKQFLISPLINDETKLLLIWDGLKLDFLDADDVPFPAQAAEAVGAYAKWKILLEVDKRPDLAREQFALYTLKRLALYREEQESQDADGEDEEYAGNPDFNSEDFSSDFKIT